MQLQMPYQSPAKVSTIKNILGFRQIPQPLRYRQHIPGRRELVSAAKTPVVVISECGIGKRGFRHLPGLVRAVLASTLPLEHERKG